MISALFVKTTRGLSFIYSGPATQPRFFGMALNSGSINVQSTQLRLIFHHLLVLGLRPDLLPYWHLNVYFLVARFFIRVWRVCNILPKIENFSPFLSRYNKTKTNS